MVPKIFELIVLLLTALFEGMRVVSLTEQPAVKRKHEYRIMQYLEVLVHLEMV